MEDSKRAAELNPGWPKPHHRMAQALAVLRQWEAALAACKEGAAIAGIHASEFRPLMDQIATQAALHGCLAGFDGRKLEVLPAHLNFAFGQSQPQNQRASGKIWTNVMKSIDSIGNLAETGKED